MKVSKGTYGKETVQSNSLVENLLKYPEIASTLILQYPQYSLNYFVDGTGRFAKEEMIGDSTFRWAIQGRLNRPSTYTGVVTGTGAGNTQFSMEFEENYLNPNDVIKIAEGKNAIVIGEPVNSANGYTYQFKFESTDPNTQLVPADYTSGRTAGTVGNRFPEGSDRGYENHVYPDWYENYMSISRKAISISGSALTDVTWIENEGQRLWYYTAHAQTMQEFLYQRELKDWYGISTVDANGNSTVTDTDGKPIYSGDGILRQIDSANIDTYNGNLTEDRITDFLAQLALNTGQQNSHWLVHTGTAGKVAFHRAMKDLIYVNGNAIWNMQFGVEMKLGNNFTTYHALGHTMTLVHNPIFDDPHLHGNDVDPATGYLKESFRMVFMNFGTTNGVSNVERKVKGAGGTNRSLIIKYIPGMVNPYTQQEMNASNSRDAFTCEMLSESCLVVRNPLSCGQLVYA
ncbi:MAG: SU10 major capsid protein [Candidatus Heimdallarchaeaceae archaeon]